MKGTLKKTDEGWVVEYLDMVPEWTDETKTMYYTQKLDTVVLRVHPDDEKHCEEGKEVVFEIKSYMTTVCPPEEHEIEQWLKEGKLLDMARLVTPNYEVERYKKVLVDQTLMALQNLQSEQDQTKVLNNLFDAVMSLNLPVRFGRWLSLEYNPSSGVNYWHDHEGGEDKTTEDLYLHWYKNGFLKL